MAGMAYNMVYNPPGGIWTDNDPTERTGHRVGEEIIDGDNHRTVAILLVLNSMAFVGSLTTIILVLAGFSNRNKFIIWMLILSIYFTATCMAATYVLGLFRIFPITMWRYIKPWGSLIAMLIWWLGLSFFLAVLHLTHFGIWLQKKLDVHMLDQELFLSREC